MVFFLTSFNRKTLFLKKYNNENMNSHLISVINNKKYFLFLLILPYELSKKSKVSQPPYNQMLIDPDRLSGGPPVHSKIPLQSVESNRAATREQKSGCSSSCLFKERKLSVRWSFCSPYGKEFDPPAHFWTDVHVWGARQNR